MRRLAHLDDRPNHSNSPAFLIHAHLCARFSAAEITALECIAHASRKWEFSHTVPRPAFSAAGALDAPTCSPRRPAESFKFPGISHTCSPVRKILCRRNNRARMHCARQSQVGVQSYSAPARFFGGRDTRCADLLTSTTGRIIQIPRHFSYMLTCAQDSLPPK